MEGQGLIIYSAVFVENLRYCYSLGGTVVVIVVQKLGHFVISLITERYLLQTRNMYSLSKEQSILTRKIIQSAFLAHLSTTCSR